MRTWRRWAPLLIAGAVACGSDAASPTPARPSPQTSTPTPTPTAAETPIGVPTPEPSGPCANDYFPVVPGVVWTYERTVGPRVSRYRQRIDGVQDAGFAVLLFDGATERDLWTCSSEGLANIEQQITGEDGGPPAPGTIWFHHVRSRGVTVPADISIGSSWRQIVHSRTVFTAGGVDHPEQQVMRASYRAVAEESISTPVGTFQALRIETRVTTHKTAPSFGNGLDQRTVTAYTQWWAAGVGLVQLMGDNGSSTTTVVLVGFRVPQAA